MSMGGNGKLLYILMVKPPASMLAFDTGDQRRTQRSELSTG